MRLYFVEIGEIILFAIAVWLLESFKPLYYSKIILTCDQVVLARPVINVRFKLEKGTKHQIGEALAALLFHHPHLIAAIATSIHHPTATTCQLCLPHSTTLPAMPRWVTLLHQLLPCHNTTMAIESYSLV